MSSNCQVTKNLNLKEIECPCCKGCVYDQAFVDYLQILRDIMQTPFYYKPGGFYRCAFYNDSLPNSSPNSKHMRGIACDILTHNWSSNEKWKFVRSAMSLGLSIGLYSAHIHADLRRGEPCLFYGCY